MHVLRRLVIVCLVLAACDDDRTIITHTNRRAALSLRDLPAMQQDGAIPVEIHGRPFETMDRETLASALRAPPGRAQTTRFRALSPGEGGPGFHGDRLVLHFNPEGAPNAQRDCARISEAETAAPRERGFEVMLSFCQGDSWDAHGYLQSLDAEPGDLEAYRNAIQQLLMAIFAETTDPDERG